MTNNLTDMIFEGNFYLGLAQNASLCFLKYM